jgi:hypothetical protein
VCSQCASLPAQIALHMMSLYPLRIVSGGEGDWPGRAGPGRSWGSGPGSAEMKGGPGGAERFALSWVAGPIALPGPAWRQHAVSGPARPGP